MSKHDDLEYRVLQMLVTKSSEGILQCNLWKDLKASSREGSRITLKLENKSLIRRERELFNGRWTYRVFLKRRPTEIDSILDVPCVACPDIEKCESNSEVSPKGCKQLNQWLGVAN